MSSPSVVDRLAALAVFESVPRADLEWLAAQGEVRTSPAGTTLIGSINPVDEMFVLLEGRMSLYVENAGRKRKLMSAASGRVLGVLPYSRFQRAPGTTIIDEDVTALVLHQRHFQTMTHDYPGLTTALVHHMLDRAREFRTVQLNDDRLQSLSRLASGFAHELNNPASAAARTAQALVGLLDEEEQAARELAAARLGDDQLAVVEAMRQHCGRAAPSRTALEAADREDDIAEWLARHGLEAGAAEPLAASEVTLAALEDLARALPPDVVGSAIRWVASGCAARGATRQIEAATGRIHDLVRAVKGFTFMDREGVPELVDVARGLADTLAMLEGKARAKSVEVRCETAADLPRVDGFGSEINQVWEKLVDNALDAVGTQGHVTITATARGDSILVRIADDGPGIAEEIRGRIFDPFFTTKPVGQGTGLGLDMARRIVHLHGGDIDFSSQPGRTVFRVRLPAAEGVKNP
jgi:signal transduction histidine kinase